MIKHLLSVSIFALFGGLVSNAVNIDGIEYSLEGDGATVTSLNGGLHYTGKLVIPDLVSYNGKKYSVTKLENEVFYGCKELESVTLPSSIVEIPYQAFMLCENLSEVNLSENTVMIDIDAFMYCKKLESIKLPSSLKAIGGYAFEGSGLVSIEMPNSVDELQRGVFRGCEKLKYIKFSDALTQLNETCSGCYSLESVHLPTNLTWIGYYTFMECSSLRSITFPNSLQRISPDAFTGCGSLQNIVIPSGVNYVVGFEGCTSLTEVSVLGENNKVIGAGAFKGCESLAKITLGNGVSSLENGAFSGCDKISTINLLGLIPPTITMVQNYASRNSSEEEGVFDLEVYSQATLFVPQESKQLYENAEGWKLFSKIEGVDFSGIDDIETQGISLTVRGNEIVVSEGCDVMIFSLSGTLIQQYASNGQSVALPRSGVYIVSIDGKAHKVVIR